MRESAGFRGADFARKMRLSHGQLSKLEHGRARWTDNLAERYLRTVEKLKTRLVRKAPVAGAVLVAVFLLLTGCASTPTGSNDNRRIESVSRLAAYLTVSADLRENPEHVAKYRAVAGALSALSKAQTWDLNAATEAVLASGLANMEGPDGEVTLSAALGVLVLVGDASFDTGKPEHAAALIRGLESGIRLATTVPGGGP
jgi:transcriptional regulator with XRE-family HTH domain